MEKHIRNISIVFIAPEENTNSNSIIIQLKMRAQIEDYLFSIENSYESALKTVKKNNQVSGIVINIDGSTFMSREQNKEMNLILAIKKTDLLLPIFLVRKNIVIALSPYNEIKSLNWNHCKIDQKDISWENVIFKSIDHYIKNKNTSSQPLPEESPTPLLTCCMTSLKFTEYQKNNTSIENELIDYFYKKIVENGNSISQENSKTQPIKITHSIYKANNKIGTNNSDNSEYVDYLIPMRNGLGLTGLIPAEQFEVKNVLDTLTTNDKRSETYREICYEIMRASTSDGLIYNINRIIKKIYDAEIKRQFNEEWALFNDYHPFFNGVFSKSILSKMRNLPPLYVAKSIHHILSALSSSIPKSNERHSTTTEKPIILIKVIINAIRFRKTILMIIEDIKSKDKSNWFFNVWQPNKILLNNIPTPFENIPEETLTLDAYYWQLHPQDEWHGFDNIAENYAMLDPTKITLLCPGQNANGEMTDFGIPAMVVVRFMENKLIIPQKSGNYSFLFDISKDSGPEKWQKIIDTLLGFKHSYDINVPLNKTFPTLIKKSSFYTLMGLRDLCEKMHITIASLSIPALFNQALLVQKRGSRHQYHQEKMENKKSELVSINNVKNRTIAITVSNNAYSQPFLIAGEIITDNNQVIIDYLLALQIFDQTFPGFEHNLQGVWRNTYGEFFVKCLIDI